MTKMTMVSMVMIMTDETKIMMEKAEVLGEELGTALCHHPQWYIHTGQTPVHSKSSPKPSPRKDGS